jgi:hypothetical protein
LFFLIGGIWIVFGVAALLGTVGGALGPSIVAWIVAGLMFANAGALIWIGWRLEEGDRRTYILGIAVLAVNILLTVTDEFGFFDLITLLIDLTLLTLLIANRSKFASSKSMPATHD